MPYEDCCTVFSPKHPRTKPRYEDILAAEQSFDFTALVEEAVEKTEVKRFKYGEETVLLN